MKKLALVLLLVAGLVSPAMAGEIQIGYAGSGYGPYQTNTAYGGGGEFTVNPLTGWLNLSGYVSGTTMDIGVAGTFQTFCIEGGENIWPYAATYDAVVNPNAVYGGVGGTGDPVSVGTGWLYSQFAMGTLAGYNYHGSAGDLQLAIWWLEGEENVPYIAGNTFMDAVIAKFGSDVLAKADGGTQYGVYALNLWEGTAARQDVLWFNIPDGGMTLMLLGGALMGLGALRRKFRV